MKCLAVVLVVWWLLTIGCFFSCFSSLSCCCCGWWHFGKGYSGIEARSGLGNTTLQPHGTVSYGLGHWDSHCLYTQRDQEIMHRISVANVPAHLLGSAMHALKFVAEPGKRFPHHVVDNKVNTSQALRDTAITNEALGCYQPDMACHHFNHINYCYLPPPPIQKAQNARHANIGLGHQICNDTKRYLWHIVTLMHQIP